MVAVFMAILVVTASIVPIIIRIVAKVWPFEVEDRVAKAGGGIVPGGGDEQGGGQRLGTLIGGMGEAAGGCQNGERGGGFEWEMAHTCTP